MRVVVRDVLENMELFLNSPCLNTTETPDEQRGTLKVLLCLTNSRVRRDKIQCWRILGNQKKVQTNNNDNISTNA